MKYYIKNMVCGKCQSIVISEMSKIGIGYDLVETGEITVSKKLTSLQHRRLSSSLRHSGLELIDDRQNERIEKLKNDIHYIEYCINANIEIKWPDFTALNRNSNFVSLNKLFSDIEGITIEKYIIKKKIDIVKRLLEKNKLSIPGIALKMHYKNVSQLSSQFRGLTGMTPLHFKQLHNHAGYIPAMN
jgi:YesN/AraC family two-component response regulator